MSQPPDHPPLMDPQPPGDPGAPGLLIVISGPSGVGKTTIVHRLLDRLGAAFSVSMTTRPKTAADADGVDYHFVDEDRFKRAIDRGELLEWARVFGHYYGTPREPVERDLAAGRDVILEIDVAGGQQVKRNCPRALSIFIMPPSERALLERLRRRGREDEATIRRRFAEAKREIEAARNSEAYDRFVVNEALDSAADQTYRIIRDHKAAAPESPG